jgi:hypothetical protein
MRRLFEDPQSPTELRDDLLRSRKAGQDYPTADKLTQLRAALDDPARDPLARRGQGADAVRQLAWRAVHPGWKLASLLVLGGTAALVLRPAPRELSLAAVGAPPQAAEVTLPPTAAEVTPPPPVEVAPAPPTAADEPGAVADDQGSSSRREIAQLVRIRALLPQDPLAAYRLAQRSEREFPRGVLSEERQALAIVALHRTGKRAAATAQAHAFFERFPQSPMRGTIEAELDRENQ